MIKVIPIQQLEWMKKQNTEIPKRARHEIGDSFKEMLNTEMEKLEEGGKVNAGN